jgi:hypothetical protein
MLLIVGMLEITDGIEQQGSRLRQGFKEQAWRHWDQQ